MGGGGLAAADLHDAVADDHHVAVQGAVLHEAPEPWGMTRGGGDDRGDGGAPRLRGVPKRRAREGSGIEQAPL